MILLPVSINIPVKGYLHHAHINSVVLGQCPKSYMWLNNLYLQVYFNRANKNTLLDFFTFQYKFECLDTGYVRPFLLKKELDIKETIEESIRNGFYITCLIDEFFVENMSAYKKRHFDHWCLIFGFDDQHYYCLGYLNDGKYQKFKLPKEEFISVFIKKEYGLGLNSVKENYAFNNNDEIAKALLQDYIYGVNTSEKYGLITSRIEGTYGINIYNDLIKETDNILDVRYAHILLEHKYCVYRYLKKNFNYRIELIEKYKTIVSNCNSIKLLSIKQYASNDINSNRRIKNLLNKTQEEEFNLLREL
jgi:hypothetical protein